MSAEQRKTGIITFEDVYFKYPRSDKFALQGINLSVTEGEFLAVMGLNGAGKSTFLKLVNGIIPHLYGGEFSGVVTVDGLRADESTVPKLAQKAGMVLDDPDAQLFTSTTRHEVAFGLENMCLPPQEIEQRVKQALFSVGLDGFQDRVPATLSGGEKQRLVIAAALAMKGKILVLDEPLCRLDPDGVKEVMSVLKEIKENFQITIIMASHESNIMAEYADRICIIKNGQIAALDTAKNILDDHKLLEENGIQPLKKTETFTAKTSSLSKNPVINISNFSFSYIPNSPSIKNINLTIYENDFLAITGKNGCGKTTLLKSITGLLRPSGGDIFIRGKNTKELSVSDISREIGFVMQNPDTQLFTDSVYNEIAFALKNRRAKGSRLSKTEIKNRVEAALEAVGLKDLDAFPHALSKTDRTKVVIACVFAMGCKIIIFDEIDVGNDYQDNIKIMNILKDLHSKGYTIIFVTHNMSCVRDYVHRLIKMDRNGIIFDTGKN